MMTRVRSTCPYCGVGCGVLVRPEGNGQAEIAGDARHPANRGRLCSKGSALSETLGMETRLLYPKIAGRRVRWDEALDLVAGKFRDTIRKHGPDAVAFYVSGQLLTEDYYVANKLMKGFIGSANIDTNSRLCMSSAVAAHKRAFGADVVPGCYEDFEQADLVVLAGSNTAWCHPVLYRRLLSARAKRGTRIVVIDPRRTQTCDEADLHLAVAPGSDVRLFNGLLANLAQRGALDRDFIAAHTRAFEAALAAARAEGADPVSVAKDCGLAADGIRIFFDWFAATPRTVTAFSQGVNQSSHGTDKVNAIVNCHLATARIGAPGMGPFSLTGQPNAMGGREVGGLANQLAAHMDFSDAADRDRVARFWGTQRLASSPGLAAVDLFRAIGAGRVRTVWIMATNPAASLPDAGAVRAALKNCDFVVVSDCVAETDTARFADVLLPAAAWGEKDGTVTNSERRISRQRAFLRPAGAARADWQIVTDVARRMGFGHAFSYERPADIFREHAALSGFENDGARMFDISALARLSDAEYNALAPVQWPVSRGARDGTTRLFTDGRFATADGKARFVAVSAQPPANACDRAYPYALNTGRVRDQWHTMTRTGLAPRLSAHAPEPFVEVHPDDAAMAGLEQGALARVETRWGSGTYRVSICEKQKRGSLFVPIHWTDLSSADSVCGRMVNAVADPISGQPEFKHTPARIAPARVGWRGFFLARTDIAAPPDCVWTRIRVSGGVLYELSGIGKNAVMPSFEEIAGADVPGERLEIANVKRSDYRVAAIADGRLTHCLILTRTGALPSREWLAGLLTADAIAGEDRMTLLSGRPASGSPGEGPLVCACFGVGQARIRKTAKAQGLASVDDIGRALRAGTNCGSCRPEIRAILTEIAAEQAA